MRLFLLMKYMHNRKFFVECCKRNLLLTLIVCVALVSNRIEQPSAYATEIKNTHVKQVRFIDDEKVVCINSDHRIEVWHLKKSGKCLTPSGRLGETTAYSFAISGNRQLLACIQPLDEIESAPKDYVALVKRKATRLNKTLGIYSLTTGRFVSRLYTRHLNYGRFVAQNGNCKAIATYGRAIESNHIGILVWRNLDGKTVDFLHEAEQPIRDPERLGPIAISPNGRYLISVTNENRVAIWDLEEKCRIGLASGPKSEIRNITFSHDSKIFAAAGFDDHVYFWNTKTLRVSKRLKVAASAMAIAFSPSENVCAVAGTRGELTLINLKTMEIRRLRLNRWGLSALAFSPNGKRIVCAGKSIYVVDAKLAKVLLHLRNPSIRSE